MRREGLGVGFGFGAEGDVFGGGADMGAGVVLGLGEGVEDMTGLWVGAWVKEASAFPVFSGWSGASFFCFIR